MRWRDDVDDRVDHHVDVDLADNILVPQHQDSIVTICMLPQCLFALANCRK